MKSQSIKSMLYRIHVADTVRTVRSDLRRTGHATRHTKRTCDAQPRQTEGTDRSRATAAAFVRPCVRQASAVHKVAHEGSRERAQPLTMAIWRAGWSADVNVGSCTRLTGSEKTATLYRPMTSGHSTVGMAQGAPMAKRASGPSLRSVSAVGRSHPNAPLRTRPSGRPWPTPRFSRRRGPRVHPSGRLASAC